MSEGETNGGDLGAAPVPPTDVEPLAAGALPMGAMPMMMPMQLPMQVPMQMPMMQMPMGQTAMPTAQAPGAPGMPGMPFAFDAFQMQNMMQTLGGLEGLPQGTGVVFAGQEAPTPTATTAAAVPTAGVASPARPAPPPRKTSVPPPPSRGTATSSRGAPPPVPARQKSVVEAPVVQEEEEEEEELPVVEELPEEIASDQVWRCAAAGWFSAAQADTAQVIKEGWLWKKAAKLNRWQKRYVRMYSTYITYYEKLPSSDVRDTTPRSVREREESV